MKKTDCKSYTYIVECEDGSFYTGVTNDVKRRMLEHYNQGEKGAKYTHSHKVKRVMMVWESESYSDALKLEYAIKKLPRKKKENLIQNPEKVTEDYIKNLEEISYIPHREYCKSIIEL